MNNIQVEGDRVIVIGNEKVAYINGEKIPFHPTMKGNSITTIGNKVFIDGFEYKDGKWKRTLKAMFYKWF
ncbi:hypothetical protein [Oceanobacillus oncorhynchi]|uniref:hypothetical protein n=1 Tax=Oceanobacillus oncorhynchi TaxID=545501 RepID=UPI0034D3E87A